MVRPGYLQYTTTSICGDVVLAPLVVTPTYILARVSDVLDIRRTIVRLRFRQNNDAAPQILEDLSMV